MTRRPPMDMHASRTRRLLPAGALAAAVALTPSSAAAAIGQQNLSMPAVAVLAGVDGSSASGTCTVLITAPRTRALGHCTVDGGRPLVAIEIRVDGVADPVFATPVPGPEPFAFTVDPLPASVVRALPHGGLTIEGRSDAGPEVRGPFRESLNGVQFKVPVHGGEVVPPVATTALAACIVTVQVGPPFVGIDCSHSLPDPQAAGLYVGPQLEVGELAIDFTAALASRNPAVWQPLPDGLRDRIAAENTYLQISGADPANVIRGQVNGCRDFNSQVCMHGRFRVTATVEPTDGSQPATQASGRLLATTFASLTAEGRSSRTETALFNATDTRDHALLFELVDGCATGQGFLLNATATDFESYRFIVTVTDMFTGVQDGVAAGGQSRFTRRVAFSFICFFNPL